MNLLTWFALCIPIVCAQDEITEPSPVAPVSIVWTYLAVSLVMYGTFVCFTMPFVRYRTSIPLFFILLIVLFPPSFFYLFFYLMLIRCGIWLWMPIWYDTHQRPMQPVRGV